MCTLRWHFFPPTPGSSYHSSGFETTSLAKWWLRPLSAAAQRALTSCSAAVVSAKKTARCRLLIVSRSTSGRPGSTRSTAASGRVAGTNSAPPKGRTASASPPLSHPAHGCSMFFSVDMGALRKSYQAPRSATFSGVLGALTSAAIGRTPNAKSTRAAFSGARRQPAASSRAPTSASTSVPPSQHIA